MSRFYKKLSTLNRVMIVSAVLLFIISTCVLVASADTSGPVLSNQMPTSGSNVPVAKPGINVSVNDLVNLTSNIAMKVNGKPVSAKFAFNPYDYRQGTISYVPITDLPDGPNTVSASIYNSVGESSSTSWSFNVKAPPQITQLMPYNYSVSPPQPTISAIVTDNSVLGSVYMQLDGNPVPAVYTTATSTISYVPPQPLAIDSVHSVQVTALDIMGNSKTATWSFTVGANAAVFSEQTPAPGSVAPAFRPEISVYVKDVVDITNARPVMTINGVNYNAWWTPTLAKPNEGRVTLYSTSPYQPTDLSVGVNTVSISMVKAGVTRGSTSWSFNVTDGPQITNFTPRMYGEVYTRPFIIRADVTSPVGIRSVSMTLDGKPLKTTWSNNQICYNPSLWEPIVPNGPHTAQVVATDNAGVTRTVTWKFTVACWVDDDKSNQQCTGCHTGFPVPNHPITGYCNDCHKAIPTLAHIGLPAGYTHDPNYITSWECTYCHDPLYAVPRHPDDNNAYHNTTTQFDSCGSCHNTSLTLEHSGRINPATGKAYDCNVCHGSTAAQAVKDAVNNKDKRCAACHLSGADHEAKHETPGQLDANCTTCHMNSLTQEHLSNTRTQSNTLACGTCHDVIVTTNPAIYRAIDLSNKQCAACHSLAHKMNLVEKSNTDIPVYEGFTWSQPVSAAIFRGDLWIPGEFASAGKVIFSNRRPDVNGDTVFNFYRDALTGKGWVLETPAPETGSNFYSATFSKGKNRVAIMFDNREYHSLSFPIVTSGYRITIIYN